MTYLQKGKVRGSEGFALPAEQVVALGCDELGVDEQREQCRLVRSVGGVGGWGEAKGRASGVASIGDHMGGNIGTIGRTHGVQRNEAPFANNGLYLMIRINVYK